MFTKTGQGLRIVVADDNEDAATSLCLILQLMGNTVETAFDGLQAVDVVQAFQPDLVFLDVGMPGLNGYDAARRIREQPSGRRVTLVALTGWGREEDRQRSRDAGFDHHLVKPLDAATLQRLIAQLAPTA